jgi:2-hydroxymuconate-semialdehyde hydrolase
MDSNPEIGRSIMAGAIRTNYHDRDGQSDGDSSSARPLLMIHGSGPGVSAWANWRLNIDTLAQGRA